MNCFDYTLENGVDVLVEYEPVDYDDHGEIEFEIFIFNDGKDIWDELSAKDQAEIQAHAGRDWQQYVTDEQTEAAINQWEFQRDFP
jgi:hypothetical protein